MAFELVYTSVPKGIRSGSSGFCTVAYTNGLAANLIVQLESMSAYKAYFPHYDANAALNPVSFSHFVYKHSGQEHHILSRICFYGQDYTRRSNKLASHIVMSSSEISAVPGGPADVFLLNGIVRSEWQGEPELFQKQLHIDAPEQPLQPANRWQEYCGDAGWAGVLAESFLENPDRPAFIVFDPLKHTDMLELIREALMLLPPAVRWKVTFNTYFTMMPAGLQCSWRCCVPGSDMLREAHRSPGILVIDLTRPMPPASESGLVQVARTGIAPEPPKPAANSAPPPPLPPVPPPVIPASAPPQQEKPESGVGTDAAESGAAVPPVIVSQVNTRTVPRITIPKINNAQPRGIQNHPYYQNAVGNGNYRNYRVESAYKGSPSQNGKSKTGILLGGLIAALILAAGASAFAIFLWRKSPYTNQNTADAERLSPKKIAYKGKPGDAKPNSSPASAQSVPPANRKASSRPATGRKSADKGNKADAKPNSSPASAQSVPPANRKASSQPAKGRESADKDKTVKLEYAWQVMQKINEWDDRKGDTWRSSSPVVAPNHGLKVKKIIVSCKWTPGIGKNDIADNNKEVNIDPEGKLTKAGKKKKGLEDVEFTLFQYEVKLLGNGFLEFHRKEKDKSVKVLTWESLELSNGTTISCKFTPGKTFINPKDTEIKVRRSNGNVSVTLEKVPNELSRQIKNSNGSEPFLVFRFNDGEFQIPLKKDKTGNFKGTKVLVQLNQSKRNFIEKLKKDPLKAKIESAKNQVKAKIESVKKQTAKNGSGITKDDLDKFSAGNLSGMPVEKIKQLLKLFKLDKGKDDLSKQFQRCVKKSEETFSEPDPKLEEELFVKLKSSDTTEICCGKDPYMRIDKSKIKFE